LMTRHVIIGNGIAGVNAAESIRSLDGDSSITMIAREKFPPYSRPMISLMLEGAIGPEKLPVRSERFYEEMGIEPILGEAVTAIDLENRLVVTDKGSRVGFDRLLIATGADPRPIKAEGSDLGNISYMRTEEHVRRMLAVLPTVNHALVLGGGLVGFKAAHALLHHGIKVTMLIKAGYPLSMQLDPTSGKMVLDEMVSRGLDVRVGIEAVGFEGNGAVRQAHLSDGSRLSCEMVVVGKGVLPANSFVPREKMAVDLGIVVNENLQTSVSDVYAAGDVAEAFDVTHGKPWVNAIWPVAVEQGRIAGMNMAGRKVSYGGSMGRNVIRVFGVDVLTGGVVNPLDRDSYTIMEASDPRNKTYRRLVLKGDALVGLAMVGHIEQGGVILSMIQRRQPLAVAPETLLERSFNYGRLLS
jgi:nitrite reductase (NADH) large subunit